MIYGTMKFVKVDLRDVYLIQSLSYGEANLCEV